MEHSLLDARKFTAGADFRIYGTGVDFAAISLELGISPSHLHRKGEHDPGNRLYRYDMWSLASPLGDDKDLGVHLNWLANRLLSRSAFILSLKEKFNVDIYCWKDCNTEQASLVLSASVLRIFTELNLDLEVGLLCLPPELHP
jgi:hypothetical protein